MQTALVYELIGYAGSILVAVSLTMTSLWRLRIINLAGAIVFVVYGLLIGALPVAFLNGLIVCVNLYNIYQMSSRRDYFKLMEVNPDSRYLKNFVEFYRKEIHEFFPSYLFKPKKDQLVVFVLRNMVPAGVLIVKPEGDTAEIFLDFVLPGYRDFRAGKFLYFESAIFFQQKGIRRLASAPGNAAHEAYLKRMGFRLEHGKYYLEIPPVILQEDGL